ncbi:MAG: lasso RiPP family leader peptide-containing protein [Gemmatimonadaceae bacterium]|nr:lasso RiPP family leader peptide-containing protein [Gemmatimonadaceae bacterium]
MYEAPKLEKFGSFRELTLGRNPLATTKRIIGDDLIPGIGMDCDGNAPAGDPRACIRS